MNDNQTARPHFAVNFPESFGKDLAEGLTITVTFKPHSIRNENKVKEKPLGENEKAVLSIIERRYNVGAVRYKQEQFITTKYITMEDLVGAYKIQILPPSGSRPRRICRMSVESLARRGKLKVEGDMIMLA